MVCSGASELAMAQWASTYAEAALGLSKAVGDLTGPCLFAVMMGTSRIIFGKYGEKLDLMKYFESVTFAQELGIEKKDKRLWLGVAERYGVEPETCTLFDDSLAACKGARSAKMRVVGVYDSFFAGDEKEMRSFCDVYIKSFEELLWKPEYRKD